MGVGVAREQEEEEEQEEVEEGSWVLLILPEQKDNSQGEGAEVIVSVYVRSRIQCYVTKELKSLKPCQRVAHIGYTHIESL